MEPDRYAVCNGWGAVAGSGEGATGCGIPVATDLALALGILALLGPRVPARLKVFLRPLDIAQDLGAVRFIALVYTDRI